MPISSGTLRAAAAAWTASKWLLMVPPTQALTLKQAVKDRESQTGSRMRLRTRTHSGALLLCYTRERGWCRALCSCRLTGCF